MTTRTDTAASYAASAIGMMTDAANATSTTAQTTMIASAQVFATLATDARLAELVEEQRTANLIAADTTDQLGNPHEIGTPEYHAYWRAHTAALAERLGLQR